MGDMAEVFNDLKVYKKQQRDSRAVCNVESLQKLGIAMRKQSKNVFRMDTEWGAVMYYPGSNMWQHRGKTGRGDVHKFRSWLVGQGFIQ